MTGASYWVNQVSIQFSKWDLTPAFLILRKRKGWFNKCLAPISVKHAVLMSHRMWEAYRNGKSKVPRWLNDHSAEAMATQAHVLSNILQIHNSIAYRIWDYCLLRQEYLKTKRKSGMCNSQIISQNFSLKKKKIKEKVNA